MKTKKRFVMSYRMMVIFSLVAGVVSIGCQMFGGYELLGYLSATLGITTLFGVDKITADSQPHLPEKSYKIALIGLMFFMMFAMVFLVISNGYRVFPKANDFLSTHWPLLMLSVMCIVLAISGLRKTNQPQNV